MTAKEELKIYKKALFHYRLTRIFPWLSKKYRTLLGFCSYFIQVHKTSLSYLTVLAKLNPNKDVLDYTPYWFKEGKKLPRIKLLKQAIKILENET